MWILTPPFVAATWPFKSLFLQKRLNEDVIDYDLLEDLICYIDETCDEGAILVFLPVRPFWDPLSWYIYLYIILSANTYTFSIIISLPGCVWNKLITWQVGCFIPVWGAVLRLGYSSTFTGFTYWTEEGIFTTSRKYTQGKFDPDIFILALRIKSLI